MYDEFPLVMEIYVKLRYPVIIIIALLGFVCENRQLVLMVISLLSFSSQASNNNMNDYRKEQLLKYCHQLSSNKINSYYYKDILIIDRLSFLPLSTTNRVRRINYGASKKKITLSKLNGLYFYLK